MIESFVFVTVLGILVLGLWLIKELEKEERERCANIAAQVATEHFDKMTDDLDSEEYELQEELGNQANYIASMIRKG